MKKTILSLSIVIIAFASITFTSCKNSPKSTEESEATEKMVAVEYQCPMKCEGEKTYTEMGTCPECGMDLMKITEESAEHNHSEEGHTH